MYQHYLNLRDNNTVHFIENDLQRTQIGNPQFKIDYKSGDNLLFNILNAYAMYDPEIGYVQGMNFITAFIIQHVKEEEDQFYFLIHIMEVLNWRSCYDDGMTNLHKLVDVMDERIKDALPEVYKHVMKQT